MAAITIPDHIVKMRVTYTEVTPEPEPVEAACTVLKSDDEKRYMLTVAYPANKADQIIKAGDWLLGMVLEPDTWALYKSGKIGGVSPQGSAKRRVPTAEALSELRS
jgi:hypothetical protein